MLIRQVMGMYKILLAFWLGSYNNTCHKCCFIAHNTTCSGNSVFGICNITTTLNVKCDGKVNQYNMDTDIAIITIQQTRHFSLDDTVWIQGQNQDGIFFVITHEVVLSHSSSGTDQIIYEGCSTYRQPKTWVSTGHLYIQTRQYANGTIYFISLNTWPGALK